ncbi:DoxX family protein [Thalassobacillus devorans]|uniref:DoxX family protein n=1 Tax=Thalassobacillus devorans TaxID=279813 RepID=UPI000A1C8B03|nr:DoxX family protein [Thalassobacillus devorans]
MNSKYAWSQVILRVVLGLTFFIHGLVKFQDGIGNTAGWFDSIGLPGFLAYVVAFLELAGGLAVLFGLGTRVISGLFVVLMAGAILKVKLAAGFLGNGQGAGYELDLVLLAMSLYFLINGSKNFALDQVLFNSNEGDSETYRSA